LCNLSVVLEHVSEGSLSCWCKSEVSDCCQADTEGFLNQYTEVSDHEGDDI